MRVVVTGGRFYEDYATLSKELDRIHTEGYKHLEPSITQLAHGDCEDGGADRLAGYWADANNIPVTPYPALWYKYGDPAGPIRNRVMLRLFHPDLVIAFPGGKGTKDCIEKATRMHIPIYRVEL